MSIRLVIEYISIEKDLHLIILFLMRVVYVGDKRWDLRLKRSFLVDRKGFCLIIIRRNDMQIVICAVESVIIKVLNDIVIVEHMIKLICPIQKCKNKFMQRCIQLSAFQIRMVTFIVCPSIFHDLVKKAGVITDLVSAISYYRYVQS